LRRQQIGADVDCHLYRGVQLVGAASLDVLGDVVNGRPTINYPDPINSAKTGSIAVEPRGQCKVTPTAPS